MTTVVRAAAANGLRVAPQSSGHAAAPLGPRLGDTVLLKLHELVGVAVDVERRTARVVGGTLWRDVIAAAAPHGLTALHGSSPDVAVAGYALGGGLSFYGRRHGLAANSIRAIEIVTADGELRRCDATQDTDATDDPSTAAPSAHGDPGGDRSPAERVEEAVDEGETEVAESGAGVDGETEHWAKVALQRMLDLPGRSHKD